MIFTCGTAGEAEHFVRAMVNAVGAGCPNTWTKAGGALLSRGTDVVSLRRR